MPESSVVIPVYNKWDLTRKCLKSLAANTSGDIEVIVVDNASTDATQRGCEFLGKQLFGENFRYIRNDVNRNFAGASNQGAAAARGEFLVFLNNDTEVQPGWYGPLIGDFDTWPDIAATGPLLVYPDETPLGRTVQHLGVFVSPSLNLGHLYEGIPASSPLARKRRFFNAITAACMVIRKSLFMDVGKFDERFVNGFEDVDLCLRISERGLRFTVNPDSLVIHHESQTPGRHSREEANSRLLTEKDLHLLTPDWHVQAKNDGLILGPNEWLMYQNMLPGRVKERLAPMLDKAGMQEILELLVAHPYWEAGWEKALSMSTDNRERIAILRPYFKLFRNPENAMRAHSLGGETGDRQLSEYGAAILRSFAEAPESFLEHAITSAKWCRKIGLDEMAARHLAWADNYENFVDGPYARFAKAFVEFARNGGMVMDTLDDNAYAIWLHGKRDPRRHQTGTGGAGFSILMPVYNPEPEHLRAALDSVLIQTWEDWELCLADDASTNPEIREIIEEYVGRDKRIRAVFRESNGRIAEATNTALYMADKRWCAFMDQDDVLDPDALAAMAEAISRNPRARLLYSDEDKLGKFGRRFYPHFKFDRWDWELVATQNFVCHLAVYERARLQEIGGLRKGFEGAQDYDLLLRYVTGLDSSEIVHVPRILYHWRAHASSTASDMGAKEYASASTFRAAQSWLDAVSPGSRAVPVPGRQWTRTEHPVPDDVRGVSLIVHLGEDSLDPLQFVEAVRRKGRLDVDLTFVCASGSAERHRARFAGVPARFQEIGGTGREALNEALNAAAATAMGSVLGFLGPDIVPRGDRWPDEVVGALWRPGVGAVGGKVSHPDGSLADGGWLADCTGILKPLFRGSRRIRYFGWETLQRTVDALSGDCLFTRRDEFLREGGFRPEMGCAAAQDYCLSLGARGLRSVWWPHAEFLDHKPLGATKCVVPAKFHERWAERVKPFNPDVAISGEFLSLNLSGPAPADFRADEYLRLYPDVAASGMDPLGHYLLHGRPEGRKGRLSRIDYSGLTPERIARWKSSPRDGVVVCTALCGDHDQLLPPAFLNDGWEYVCYSDKPREGHGVWDIREIPYENSDPTRRSRWAKMNLPFLFPKARRVFWMDSNIVIGGNLSELVDEPGNGLWLVRHHLRECVFQEAAACIAAGKDSKEALEAQAAAYAAAGMPEMFGLWENNLFMVDPRNERVANIFSHWWKEYLAHSRRDQLSLPYVLFRSGLLPTPLLPRGRNARNWPALHFLTHEETWWIRLPKTTPKN